MAVGSISWNSMTSLDAVRTHLQDLVNADRAYSWLGEIVGRSLDEYVDARLDAKPPDPLAFDPSRVEVNLSAANDLLDVCLTQRAEIHELEARAMLTALELSLGRSIQSFDKDLAKAHLAAATATVSNTAGKVAPIAATDQTVDERDAVVSAARATRLLLHGLPGSPLNFGERVTFLRRIYVSNLRLVYEHLHAVRLGASAAFGVVLPQVPKWSGTANFLERLVFHARGCVDTLERGDRFERTAELVFLLGSQGFLPQATVQSALRSTGAAELRFTIKSKDMAGIDDDTHAIRLLSVGVGLTFSENELFFQEIHKTVSDNIASSVDTVAPGRKVELFNLSNDHLRRARDRLVFSGRLSFPIQIASQLALPPAYSEWHRETMTLGAVSTWSYGSPLNSVVRRSGPDIANTNPLGEWEISLDPAALDVDQLRERRKAAHSTDGNNELTIPTDVVLLLRIAIRRRIAPLPFEEEDNA